MIVELVTPRPSTSTELRICSSHLGDSEEIKVKRITSPTHQTEYIDHQINGRRFVDIQDFFNDMQKANDHSPYTCNLDHMDMCSESHDGLICSIKLKCRMCQTEKCVRTEAPGDKLNVNSALVLASISTGLCFAQTTQILSTMNMPQLSRRQFDKHFANVSETILATSWEAMEEAGIEEGRIAREIGDVDKDDCPLISVIADGAWSKRSYRTKYDASSGVACIVGAKTGKLLFVAIRNKYCPMCERSKIKNIAVSEHRCYKNWSGTSTAMESDIILEGFTRTMEMHGLKYIQLVGDMAYGNGIMIEKVECKNHLLRNFCTKLRELATKNVSSKLKNVSPRLRTLLKSNIERLRKGISAAVTYRRKEDKTITEQLNALKKDIINCSKHVFGEHSDCAAYFCIGPKENEVNEFPNLVECGLFDDIIVCCNRLTHNAHSFLLNMNNNAEEYHRLIHKKMTQNSPGRHSKLYVSTLQRSRRYLKSRAQLFPTRSRKRTRVEADEDYGLAEDIIPAAVLEEKKSALTNYLNRTRRVSSFRKTNYWSKYQPNLEKRTKFATNSIKFCVATSWGQDQENLPKKQFSEEYGHEVQNCGLFVSAETPYLGASPDGLVGADVIMEIKCPYKIAKLKVTPEKKLVPYLLLEENILKFKKTHDYFYQIQGQLAITERRLCYFVVWTPLGMMCQEIEKDDNFWQKIKPKLEEIYLNYMLPLLALKKNK